MARASQRTATKATKSSKRKFGHGASTINNLQRGISASARRAGNGTGDPGRHKVRPSERKGRAGTTTDEFDRPSQSGELENTMKNKRLAPSRAAYAAEGSDSPRPSRKSTRRAANRVKAASQLTRRAQRKVGSPAQRAARSLIGNNSR